MEEGSAQGPASRFVQLPTDVDRSAAIGFEAASSSWVVLESADAAARQAELLGALAALLHRYTQQTELSLDVFGHDAAGDQPAQIEFSVPGNASIRQLIDQARTRLTAAPLSTRSTGGHANIASTFVVMQNEAEGPSDARNFIASEPSCRDMHFVFAQARGASFLALVYNARLIGDGSASRLIENYVCMLGEARRKPTAAVEQLDFISAAEIRALTTAQDSGTANYSALPVHRRFEALAGKQPNAAAASFRGQRITYGELEERSNRLAHYLAAHQVARGIPVAVCVRPSLDILVAMLAIWKAGGVYLPLDPAHPEALIARMVGEARPRLVLTSLELSALTAQLPQLHLDADGGLLTQYSNKAPSIEPDLDDAAYLFYTSGTTGKPKGVLATQGNLAQYIGSAAHKYGFCSQDVFCSLARYTFSISLFELVSPLCCGASVHILERDEILDPARLHRALDGVTVVHAGPSLLGSLFRHLRSTQPAARTFPRMRHASSGGDMVSPAVMEQMKQVFPNAELFVIYGCTEVSCMGTTYPIARGTATRRTFVGKPFPNVALRVMDSNEGLVPFGAVGEICFAGYGVVPGYLDRPELTAEKFVETQGRRFYRSGDMGRLHPDGNLEILGRRDFQIQLRGIRIELAGIEKTVQALGLAAQCAVLAKAVGEGDVRLIAFVVNPSERRIAAFRRALSLELPDYMLPQHLVVLDAMPLTANGKLDRNRLKEMPWQAQEPADGRSSPANDRERKIAGIFASVLGLSEVGTNESFFDLGGDSLLGIVLLDNIRHATGVAIPPGALFESGTVQALAVFTESTISATTRPILLNGDTSGPPLFMLSGIHVYRKVAQRLQGQCPAYGVFAKREVDAFDAASGRNSVYDLARDYLEIIRAEQAKGPYRLLGYSFAGIVAYEVAQQIRASGEEVSLLVLIDTFLLEWVKGWRFRFAQIARLPFVSRRDLSAFVLRRLRGKKIGGEFDGLHQDDEMLGALERQRDSVNMAAAAEYMTQLLPYDGAVTLIVSNARLRDDPLKSRSGGWSPYISQLDIQSIDAHHLQMISDEPHVSEVAAILAKRIQ